MASSDRIAFFNTNVTFTPSSSNTPTTLKVASLTLNEEVTEVDATTTEDGGYAFNVLAISKISGSIRVFHREGENLPILARAKGNLTWNVNTTNPATNGNYTVPIQVGSITRGEADVRGVVPCTINFSGQGGWTTGSLGK